MKPIEPVPGERGRFYAPSDSGRGTYVVDLTEAKPSCNCTDYTARRIPAYKKSGNIEDLYCKHIKRAREFIFQQYIKAIKK